MRFAKATGALDRLADSLRRADATWHGGEIFQWDALPESAREQWRAMARTAAAAVSEEIRKGDGTLATSPAPSRGERRANRIREKPHAGRALPAHDSIVTS